MDTTIDSGAVVIATIVYVVLIAGFYVWSSLALSKVFVKLGIPAWKAWVPVINTIEILKLGGHEAWNIVWFFIPFLSVYGVVLWIISLHRITVKFGQSILFSIVAVVAFPVWASILGFGSAQPDGQTDRRIATAPSGAPWGGTAAAQPFGAPSAVPAYPASQGPSSFATFPAAPAPVIDPAPVVASAPPVSAAPVASPVPPAPPAGVTLPPPSAPAAVTPPPVAPPAPVAAPVPPVVLPTAAPPAASATPPELVEPVAHNPWAPSAPAAPIAPPVAAPVISAPPAASVAPPVSQVPAPVAPPAPPVAPPAAPAVVAPVAATPAPVVEDDADEDERTVVVNRKPVIRWHLVAPTGQRLPLVGDDIVLGRKPTAADGGTPLAVPDTTKTLSRIHARLTRAADDSWTITDLNATNGVIVIDAAGGESELAAGASAPVATSFILGEVRLSIEFDAES